jgi:uncharacterized protein YjaZ
MRDGLPLTDAQLADARRIGIVQPERVRVLEVPTIPPRVHPALRYLSEKFGMSFTGTIGMALGYGVFICSAFADDRALLAHELAHVKQYERLGFRDFLRQYLRECLCEGYPHGALEAEARDVSDAICA